MMSRPETRYAKSGDVHIAYQVTGSGPRDIVLVAGFVSHLELDWDVPALAHFGNSEGGPMSLLFAATWRALDGDGWAR